MTLFLGTEVAGSEPGASTRTRPALTWTRAIAADVEDAVGFAGGFVAGPGVPRVDADAREGFLLVNVLGRHVGEALFVWCREHEGGSDARVAQASPGGVPVKVEQGGVGEHARDRVGVRGLGEFVDNGGVGVGHVQCRKARTGHEARVGDADGGSREVVVAVVVVVDESPAKCVMSCARVVVGAMGAFCGEAAFEGFAHRFGQDRPGDGVGRRESVRVKCGDASSRNEKSGNLASCLLAGGVLFRPLAIRYDVFPGHRGYDTPGSQKAPSAKRCIIRHKPARMYIRGIRGSESTERQKVH